MPHASFLMHRFEPVDRFLVVQLGSGLKYDKVPDMGRFPHFYGLDGGLHPISLSAIVDAQELKLVDGVHVVPYH